MPETSQVNILLVEDDQIDVRFIKKTFQSHRITNPIYVASDGIEALEILRGEGGREPLARPYLILLDINMPRMNGIQFLQELRGDPRLSNSIVFVLTTSAHDQDKESAYAHNVAGYLLKSGIGGDFMNAIRMLENFLVSIQFPSEQ